MTATDVDWIAAIVAGVVGYALGALWYSPFLLGKPWQRYMGWSTRTPEEVKALQKKAAPAYGASFLAWIVMAIVLAVLVGWAEAVTWVDGAAVAALVWLGFVATVGFTRNMFHGHPFGLSLVDGGYQLLSMMVMGAIVAAWPW